MKQKNQKRITNIIEFDPKAINLNKSNIKKISFNFPERNANDFTILNYKPITISIYQYILCK